MTNIEKLEEVIKETFPDIFENEPGFTVTVDFCNIVCCDDRDCMKCYLNSASIDKPYKPYELMEYKRPNSNNNSSNSTTAITSSGIAW